MHPERPPGILSNNKIEATTAAEWRKVMSVNVDGAFFMTQACVPHMIAQKWGRIVNMSSWAWKSGGLTAGTAYSTSKAAITGLTFSTARQYAGVGITANGIAPCYVMSPMVSEQLTVSGEGAASTSLRHKFYGGRLGVAGAANPRLHRHHHAECQVVGRVVSPLARSTPSALSFSSRKCDWRDSQLTWYLLAARGGRCANSTVSFLWMAAACPARAGGAASEAAGGDPGAPLLPARGDRPRRQLPRLPTGRLHHGRNHRRERRLPDGLMTGGRQRVETKSESRKVQGVLTTQYYCGIVRVGLGLFGRQRSVLQVFGLCSLGRCGQFSLGLRVGGRSCTLRGGCVHVGVVARMYVSNKRSVPPS
jgi:NAD(P)-dependent dehydrogenase (short-subunit alcohol dehydrogenase family)